MPRKRKRVTSGVIRKRRRVETHTVETTKQYENPFCSPIFFIDFENNVDDEPPPLDFKFITNHHWHKSYPKPKLEPISCKPCVCLPEEDGQIPCDGYCSCQNLGAVTDGQIDPERRFFLKPFTLLPTTIAECNRFCPCDPEKCKNRLLYHKHKHRIKLVVSKEPGKGWGIRARQKIGKGYFICEYIGEIISESEADKRGKKYDQSKLSYLWTQGSDGMTSGGTIDATYFGNIARFANHSCMPNCFAVEILMDNRVGCANPRIAFFAGRDIEIGEEITIDYSYPLDVDEAGAIPCKCGSECCRGRIR